MSNCDEVWSLLTSGSKLDRDRGERELEAGLASGSFPLETLVNVVLDPGATSWERRLGVLLAGTILCRHDHPLPELAPR